jgi:type VI protein secretion system component Hcp
LATWIELPGSPRSACRSYRHHVHAPITRDRRLPDPRVVGRSIHEDFVVTKDLDHLSPVLLELCAAGTLLERVDIWVERPGELDPDAPPDAPPGPPTPWFHFALHHVLVTSVLTSIEDSGPLETVGLSYGSIRWIFDGPEHEAQSAWKVYDIPS